MPDEKSLRASRINFVNLTGHDVHLGSKVLVSTEPKPTRLLNGRVLDGELVIDEKGHETIPIYRFNCETQIVGLPEPEEGTLIIVSPMVRKYLTTIGCQRSDVVSPYAIETKVINGERVQCANALAR
jgi:hypothetical protein